MTIPSGKDLTLERGRGTTFSVNMEGVAATVASVAINGETTDYTAVSNALTAANDATSEASVTLFKDYSATVSFSNGSAPIVLDLNGRTIAGQIAVAAGTSLTINDSSDGAGKVTKNTANTTIVNNGTLAINGGAFENTSTKYALINQNSGTVTINGGSFTSSSAQTIYNYSGTMTINGGSFKNEYTGTTQSTGAVVYVNTGSAEINGGYYYTCTTATTKRCFLKTNSGTVNITSAYFNTGIAAGYRDTATTTFSSSANVKHSHNGVELTYAASILPNS